MVFTRNLHFYKYFDFTTFPFILPPGKGHQGRFLLLCFPAKLRALPFQFGMFPFFPFLSSLSFKNRESKETREERWSASKNTKVLPHLQKCRLKALTHSRLTKGQVSAKLPELNPLLENTCKNPFLFQAQLCQTPQHGCSPPNGLPLRSLSSPSFAGRQQAAFAGSRAPACRRARWHRLLAAKPAGHQAGKLVLLGQLPGFWLPTWPGSGSCLSAAGSPGSAGSLSARCCVDLHYSNKRN